MTVFFLAKINRCPLSNLIDHQKLRILSQKVRSYCSSIRSDEEECYVLEFVLGGINSLVLSSSKKHGKSSSVQTFVAHYLIPAVIITGLEVLFYQKAKDSIGMRSVGLTIAFVVFSPQIIRLK